MVAINLLRSKAPLGRAPDDLPDIILRVAPVSVPDGKGRTYATRILRGGRQSDIRRNLVLDVSAFELVQWLSGERDEWVFQLCVIDSMGLKSQSREFLSALIRAPIARAPRATLINPSHGETELGDGSWNSRRNSAPVMSLFAWLQGMHAGKRLFMWSVPPLERGTL
jgi:hypothetical protein